MSEIFNNARVIISTSTAAGTRDVSNRVMSLELDRDADEHDDTVMGLTAHSRVIGLESWGFSMSMLQAFSTGDQGENTDLILREIYARSKSGGKCLITVRKDNSARGANNPEWEGLVVLKNYSPLKGEIGDLLTTDVEFLGSGNLTQYACSS